jgi:hypothetical protein
VVQPTFLANRVVVAILAVGMAVVISGFAAVRAERVQPTSNKTFSCSSGKACVTGNSTGTETFGVLGYSNATSGHAYGVEGSSSNGAGVHGASTAGSPSGHSSSGVYGKGSIGVYAESADTTGKYAALAAVATGKYTLIFDAANSGTGGQCLIDSSADFFCYGSDEANSLRLRHRNSSGRHVLTYGSESASASLEDAGSARLVAGVANVALDRAFASTIDRSSPYYVFLTPMGETRGLYVSEKTPAGFQVREAQGGHSAVSFDYRIVARPLDAKTDRLPPAPIMRKPPSVPDGTR